MQDGSNSLATFRTRVAAAVQARMERESLGLSDLARELGWHKNKLFRAINPGRPIPSTGKPYRARADCYFELLDWLGAAAYQYIRELRPTSVRDVEETILALDLMTLDDWDREEMIAHVRLVLSGALKRDAARQQRRRAS